MTEHLIIKRHFETVAPHSPGLQLPKTQTPAGLVQIKNYATKSGLVEAVGEMVEMVERAETLKY